MDRKSFFSVAQKILLHALDRSPQGVPESYFLGFGRIESGFVEIWR
jgi:hypothetical protein